ncbi:MAG: SPOR domain-containing protein [Ignavibacteria bacterium]|jgi:cell division septation protein DedD
MLKKFYIVFILFGLFILPLYFSSCCGEESCSEEDTYGKVVFKKTDTVYKKTSKMQRGPMSVQIGAFVNKNNADYFTSEAKGRLNVDVYNKLTPEGVYRILIGEYNDIESAREMMQKAKSSGYEDAFIRDEFGTIER